MEHGSARGFNPESLGVTPSEHFLVAVPLTLDEIQLIAEAVQDLLVKVDSFNKTLAVKHDLMRLYKLDQKFQTLRETQHRPAIRIAKRPPESPLGTIYG